MKLSTLMTFTAMAVFGSVIPASATIVVNGGFESQDGSDPLNAVNWTGENGTTIVRTATGGVGGTAGMLVSNVAPASAAGPAGQFTGAAGGDPLVAGTNYTFSFDSQRTYVAGGVFQALVFARDAINNPIGGPVVNATLTTPSAGFTNSSYNFIAPVGATQLSIEFFAITGGDIGTSSSVIVDNVSVFDPTAVVPEPASLGLVGVAGLGLLARRRKA